MYKKTILDNGLTVATRYMPERVSVSLGIWIKAGGRYEEKNINGISHFLEHLLFKGTSKRTCEEIKQSIEGIGGSLNGFTTEELTCYLAKVPGKYLACALDVLWDMVLNANLTPGDIETERRVILEEIKMYKDLPSHFVLELLMKLLWPSQPLGMNIAGEAASIRAMNRNQLVSYKQRLYQLNNMVVIACGNLRHSQVLQACRGKLSLSRQTIPNGEFRRRSSSAPRRITKEVSTFGEIDRFVPAQSQKSGPQLKFQIKDTEQTHLALGVYGLPKTHPKRFGLGLLHIILGANMSSRLFREIREERGLAYEIGTSLKFLQDTGAFIVHAGIDNNRVVETLEVILQQLREIKKTPIEKEELNRAKEYYIGQLMLALEGTSSHMLWLGESVLYLKKIFSPEEIIRRVKKIKADDLNKLANKIFQNCSLSLALIGPLKEKAKLRIEERLTF